MEIKVGSEWVNSNGKILKVLFVGNVSALCQWPNGKECNPMLQEFGDRLKPAPVRRTVWLNVYENIVKPHQSKREADMFMADGCLFQQEVELIDPKTND